MGSPAFFLMGVGRSGTSILQYALSQHPQLLVSHELRVLELALLAAALVDRDGELLVEEPRGYSDFALLLGPAFAEALGRAQLESAGKRGGVYADKYPPYCAQVEALERLFPEARFVHILRDGRDVVASAIQAFVADRGWRRGKSVASVAQLAQHWAREVARARGHARRLGAQRYHELRYEDLLEQPQEVLAALLAFLGLPLDGSLGRMAALLQPGRSWRATLAHDELVEFDAVAPAHALLAELGYPPSPLAHEQYQAACPTLAWTRGIASPTQWAEAARSTRSCFAELRALRALPEGDESGALARALLERHARPESLFAALQLREDASDAARGALARWSEHRGLDAAAARALYELEDSAP